MEWVDAVLTGVGTILGIIVSALINTKMTNYRIEQLERKVDKHNHVVERMYHLEEQQKLTEQRMKFYHSHDGGAN